VRTIENVMQFTFFVWNVLNSRNMENDMDKSPVVLKLYNRAREATKGSYIGLGRDYKL